MNNISRRSLVLIIIVVIAVLGGIGYLVYNAQKPKLTPEQKTYYNDKDIIHAGPTQASDELQPGTKPTIILENAATLYQFTTSDQFQYIKQALADYLYKQKPGKQISASVAGGSVVAGRGTDFSFILVVPSMNRRFNVRIHPIDYYTATIFVDNQQLQVTPQQDSEEDPAN